jgi:hypothetical protein
MRQKNKGMKKTGVLGFMILCLLSGCAQQSVESTEATTVAAVEAEALETVELKRAEVGDIVQMGTYEQDGDTETEDPIYWDVLDKDGDSILIISHDVIGYQRFSDSPNCVIWKDSQIRTWLNEEFYTDAFDKETQARIKESVLKNPSIAGYVTGADESIWESRGDTTDRIFLLSWKEMEKYYGHKLPKAEALLCKPSEAVLQRYEEIKQQRIREKVPFGESAPDVTEGISWMLRSTGKSQNQISIIRGDGYYSQCMADYYQGVRPAMWIYVSDENGEGQTLQE